MLKSSPPIQDVLPELILSTRHLTSQSALFNFQSLLLVILLMICTCVYARSLAPGLVDRNKDGFLGLFFKFARIGERQSRHTRLGSLASSVTDPEWCSLDRRTLVALRRIGLFGHGSSDIDCVRKRPWTGGKHRAEIPTRPDQESKPKENDNVVQETGYVKGRGGQQGHKPQSNTFTSRLLPRPLSTALVQIRLAPLGCSLNHTVKKDGQSVMISDCATALSCGTLAVLPRAIPEARTEEDIGVRCRDREG